MQLLKSQPWSPSSILSSHTQTVPLPLDLPTGGPNLIQGVDECQMRGWEPGVGRSPQGPSSNYKTLAGLDYPQWWEREEEKGGVRRGAMAESTLQPGFGLMATPGRGDISHVSFLFKSFHCKSLFQLIGKWC